MLWFNGDQFIKYWAFPKWNIGLIYKNLWWWFLIINQSKISKFIQNFYLIFKMRVYLQIFVCMSTYFYFILLFHLLFILNGWYHRWGLFRNFLYVWKFIFAYSKTGFWYLIIWLHTFFIIGSIKWIYWLFSNRLFNKLF